MERFDNGMMMMRRSIQGGRVEGCTWIKCRGRWRWNVMGISTGREEGEAVAPPFNLLHPGTSLMVSVGGVIVLICHPTGL